MTTYTSLPTADRYFIPGTTKVLIVPLINALATGATRAELSAGTDVSDEIAAIAGFMLDSSTIDTPDLGARFVKQVTGRLTAGDSSIDFWADRTGDDIRQLLARDQSTHIVFMDGGDVPASPMDNFKVMVRSVGKPRDIEGVQRISVKFAITGFAENIDTPAIT